MPPAEPLVFISYAHDDQGLPPHNWLERLDVFLKQYQRSGLQVWHDRKIAAGSSWMGDIQTALEQARVAILLVGPHFIGSEFINNHELPPLLEAAREHGTRIFPLVTGYCSYGDSELGSFQAFNDPDQPLEALSFTEQNRILNALADAVDATMQGHEKAEGNAALVVPPPVHSGGSGTAVPPHRRTLFLGVIGVLVVAGAVAFWTLRAQKPVEPPALPVFTTHYVIPPGELQPEEYEIDVSHEYAAVADSLLRLERGAFVELEDGTPAYEVVLHVTNTSTRSMRLEVNRRFFRLADEQGREADLIYFCCETSSTDFLSPGRHREVHFLFGSRPEWSGKRGASTAEFQVRGFLPVERAAWQISLPVAAR